MTERRDVMVRNAELSDAPAVAHIYNHYIAEGPTTAHTEVQTIEEVAALISSLSDRETLRVLLRDGAVIGWALLRLYSDRPGYRHAAATSIYLDKSAVGHGYGTFLKRDLIEFARAHDHHHLVAKIFANNQKAIAYNQRLGYRTVGTQREIVRIEGHRQDIVLMELLL